MPHRLVGRLGAVTRRAPGQLDCERAADQMIPISLLQLVGARLTSRYTTARLARRGSCSVDGCGNAIPPRLAVAKEHDLRVYVLERIEGRQRRGV